MINYAILVKNEVKELSVLLQYLSLYIDASKIKIVVDSTDNPVNIYNLLNKFNIDYYLNRFESFSKQRNFLLEKCDQNYVFWIDADELPEIILLTNLENIVKNNPLIDIFAIPRENYLANDTDKEIPYDIGPPPDIDGRIGWPDYQFRLHKRLPEIKWDRLLHEQLIGSTKIAVLPPEKQFSLLHVKLVSEQIKRKEFYDKLKNDNLC